MKKKLYDGFVCAAQDCDFTCCNGWEILLDSKECEARIGQSGYIIGCNDRCPFERKDGLCNIVIECGDAGLPPTCRTFPRFINEYDNYQEYSLSLGCPRAFDMVCENAGMAGCGDNNEFDEEELYIRQNIIRLLKEDNRPDLSLLASWLYLTGNNDESIGGIQYNTDLEKAAIYEINSLFQDITVNYLNVKKYYKELEDIWEYSLENDVWDYEKRWEDFKKEFGKWDGILCGCLAEKIYFSCVSEDITEMVQELQIIITEYIMVRYSCFLKYLMGDETDYGTVRKYVVIFSRILGHNSESVKEFFESAFSKKIWETDYAVMVLQ